MLKVTRRWIALLTLNLTLLAGIELFATTKAERAKAEEWVNFSNELHDAIKALQAFEDLVALEHEGAFIKDIVPAGIRFYEDHSQIIEHMDELVTRMPTAPQGSEVDYPQFFIPPLAMLMKDIGTGEIPAQKVHITERLRNWRERDGEKTISNWQPWQIFQGVFKKLDGNTKAKALDNWEFIKKLVDRYLEGLDGLMLVRMNRIMLEQFARKFDTDTSLMDAKNFPKIKNILANCILHGVGPIMQKILQVLSELSIKSDELSAILSDLLNSIAEDDTNYIKATLRSHAAGKNIKIVKYFGGGSIAGVYKGEIEGKGFVALKIIRKRIGIMLKLEGEAINEIAEECGRAIYAKQLVDLVQEEAKLANERRNMRALAPHYTDESKNFKAVTLVPELDSQSQNLLITTVAEGISLNKILEDREGEPEEGDKLTFYTNLLEDLIAFDKTIINKGLDPTVGYFTGDPHPGNFNYFWSKKKRTLWVFDMALAGYFQEVALVGSTGDYRKALADSVRALREIYQQGVKVPPEKKIELESVLRGALKILVTSSKRSEPCKNLDKRIIDAIVQEDRDKVSKGKSELTAWLNKQQKGDTTFNDMKKTVLSVFGRGKSTAAPIALSQLAERQVSPGQALKMILEALRTCGVEVASDPFLFNRASFLMSRVVRKAQDRLFEVLGITREVLENKKRRRFFGLLAPSRIVTSQGALTKAQRDLLEFDPDQYYESQLNQRWTNIQ